MRLSSDRVYTRADHGAVMARTHMEFGSFFALLLGLGRPVRRLMWHHDAVAAVFSGDLTAAANLSVLSATQLEQCASVRSRTRK